MKTIKLNLNKSIINLDGQEIPNSNIGKILGQTIANSSKGDAIKLWSLAQNLYANGDIEVDEGDLITLKDFVKSNDNMPIITKAQILLELQK